MRIKRKRGACIGLSFLLAVGSISFPGYAQEQGSLEVSTEAPAEEATEQAHVGPEDAGEMLGTVGPGEAGEGSADEAISDAADDTPDGTMDKKDGPAGKDAIDPGPDIVHDALSTGEDTPGADTAGQAEDEEPAEETAPAEGPVSPVHPDMASSLTSPEAGETVVTISYDDNTPLNGKYFAHDRMMTLRITAPGFDESFLSLEIRVNGEGGTHTLDEVRQGRVSGAEIGRAHV